MSDDRDRFGFPRDAVPYPGTGTTNPRAKGRAERDAALDALIEAGASLAQTVCDLKDAIREEYADHPKVARVCGHLEGEVEDWEAAYARVDGRAA